MPGLLAILLAALCAAAPAQTKTHEDPGHGFSFQVPKRFKRLPVEKDRHCVLAHYISTRGYPIPGVRWLTHRPSIRVVHLPKPTPKALEASKQASKDTDKPKQTQVYDDYRDYLKRNLSGELSFENADQTAVAGLPCTKLGVNRHETGRDYYLQTWIFERGALTYAIEVMVISSQRKKLWPELSRCLESFQLAGTPSGRQPARLSVPLWRKDPARWQKLGAEQRAKERKAFEEEVFEHVENNLLPGWRLEHTDNCLFVTDSKDKYVSVARLAAERCRGWLHDVFGEVNDEYVMKPVIRIFDNRTDRNHG